MVLIIKLKLKLFVYHQTTFIHEISVRPVLFWLEISRFLTNEEHDFWSEIPQLKKKKLLDLLFSTSNYIINREKIQFHDILRVITILEEKYSSNKNECSFWTK